MGDVIHAFHFSSFQDSRAKLLSGHWAADFMTFMTEQLDS